LYDLLVETVQWEQVSESLRTVQARIRATRPDDLAPYGRGIGMATAMSVWTILSSSQNSERRRDKSLTMQNFIYKLHPHISTRL
jgi:hypothetical protein